MERKLIKTKAPIKVALNSALTDVVYYEKYAEQRHDMVLYEGQVGIYTYIIRQFVMDNGNLIPAFQKYPELKDFQGVYKLQTWLKYIGCKSAVEIDANIQEMMISEMARNSARFQDLSAEDYEPYTIKIDEEISNTVHGGTTV